MFYLLTLLTVATTDTLYPADVLDLEGWKLQSCIGLGKGNATNISEADLQTYTESNTFYTNGDGVVLKVPLNICGATTSGSKYPRVELRENENFNVGTASSGTHQMWVTMSVDHLLDTNKMSIVQLKGVSGVFVEFFAVPSSGKVQFMYNQYYSSSAFISYTFASKVELGEIFDISLLSEGTNVTATVNGVSNTIATTGDGVDATTGEQYYFKTGDYCQKLDITSSEYCQLTIYSLDTYHSN
jgi:hypothetical protein